MSSNDHNEWTDSLDFESLADEQEANGFGDVLPPVGASEAAEPAPAEAVPAAAAEDDAPVQAPRTNPRPPRRARVSGAGLGFLFALSILVAAVGLAGALVTALGVDPVGLWQPAGLLPVERIIDFPNHPLNLVYIVAAATVLLSLLGASSIARAVRKVGAEAARDARLLDKLTALRIDDEKGWQDPLFKKHPTAAAFVNENVGAWRLQEARQRRATGLEGELQRLLRAAGSGERDALNDRFDNPAVGSLADELLRHHDEREAAVQEAAAIRAKDREEAERLMGLIVEACGWTTAATDKVGVQGAAVERVAAALRRLADQAGARGQGDPVAEAVAAVAALRGNLSALRRGAEHGAPGDLEDLVDRSNKLAFQIAMEVARLGPRGERLLPMTQALEELATEFRQAADAVGGTAVPEDTLGSVDQALGKVQTALEEASAGNENWRRTVRDSAPAAAEAAGQLLGLATGFNGQSERLNRAGEACALMTGLEFDPAAVAGVDPVEAPAPDLGFTRFDPFGARVAGQPASGGFETPLAADPFATDGIADRAAADPFAADGGADRPEADVVAADGTPDLPEADPFAITTDAPFAAPAHEPAAAPAADSDPFLAADPEPVYDLTGFGARPAAADDDPADDDAVLDLGSFGAMRLDEDPAGFAAAAASGTEETIHELAEFGAVPLD